MTVPLVTTGRGAWTTTGKGNGSRYYTYKPGLVLDGSQPTKDVNFQAVNYGVKAIQKRVNSYDAGSRIPEDGVYGQSTAEAVALVQHEVLAVGVDGVVGPTTAKALFKDYLIWFGGAHHVPASQLHGFIMLESGYDPGAVGVTTPSDRGLNQINENAHPDITDDMAFDPIYSINYTAKRLSDARIKFSGKTVELKNYCAIAQHNSPRDALIWYNTGSPPTEKIKKYVDLVLGHALSFRA
jgi:peptidoglycan hydrolase-like protein with peptidoglycan-binding domain